MRHKFICVEVLKKPDYCWKEMETINLKNKTVSIVQIGISLDVISLLDNGNYIYNPCFIVFSLINKQTTLKGSERALLSLN